MFGIFRCQPRLITGGYRVVFICLQASWHHAFSIDITGFWTSFWPGNMSLDLAYRCQTPQAAALLLANLEDVEVQVRRCRRRFAVPAGWMERAGRIGTISYCIHIPYHTISISMFHICTILPSYYIHIPYITISRNHEFEFFPHFRSTW